MDVQGAPTASRPLRRSRSDRVLGGVCGGVAQHLGFDPILVRIVTVALVVFGGSGVLIYAIAWLAIPAEAGGDEPAASVLDTAGTGRVLVGAALVGIGAFTLVTQFVPWLGSVMGPLLLISVGAGVLLLTGDQWRTRAQPDDPLWFESSTRVEDVSPAESWRTESVPGEPSPLEPERAGRAVAGVLLVLGGVLWLFDLTGVLGIAWRTVLPAALVAVGVATIALAWRGRADALVGWGVVLAVAVVVTSVLPAQLSASVGERVERPASITDLQPDYALGMGTLTVDLRQLDFDSDRAVEASVGMGELVVIVPPDIAVEVDASVGGGEIVAFDRTRAGLGIGLIDEFASLVDTGDSTLRLELSVGLGRIEVRR